MSKEVYAKRSGPWQERISEIELDDGMSSFTPSMECADPSAYAAYGVEPESPWIGDPCPTVEDAMSMLEERKKTVRAQELRLLMGKQ